MAPSNSCANTKPAPGIPAGGDTGRCRPRQSQSRARYEGGNQPAARSHTRGPNGKTAYVPNPEDGTVTPIRTATSTAGPPIPVGKIPDPIVITPNGKTAYVANTDDGTVTPIRTASNTAGPPITVGQQPNAIAVTPDGHTVYVGNTGDGTVTPIRTATSTAGAPITVGERAL